MTPQGPPRMQIQKCIQVPLMLIRNSIAKCPPKSATRAIFFEYSFSVWNQKNLLRRFYWMPGAGRAKKKFNPFRTEIVLETQSWTCACSATNCSHEGPPMMDPSTDLPPAQKLTAGDAQKLTSRFLNVSEEFSSKKLLYQNVYSLYQSSYLLFSTKNGRQNGRNLKNAIFDLESKFFP